MGCCYSSHKCDLVALHELQNGDHISINNCCNNINAIIVDIEQNLCVYLDTHSKYVTETHLSTLCKTKSKVYRYDYSAMMDHMSQKDAVANSKFFARRGKFSKCCFTSSYRFAYNCKVNRYTSMTMSESTLLPIKEVGITHDQESLLSDMRNSAIITPNMLDYHITSSIDSAGAMDRTIRSMNSFSMAKTQNDDNECPSNKASLETQIDRMHDQIKSIDDKIKNIQNNISNQNVKKVTQETENQKNKLSESPIIAEKSMTLTPIRCQTAHSTPNNHLGVLVINDIDSSGMQFSVVGSSMSISRTPIKKDENTE